MGGTTDAAVITGSGEFGIVARINVGDATYFNLGFFHWRKLVTDSSNLLKYVTALAVSPDGATVAVHASDTTQSTLAFGATSADPHRNYDGSLYSFIFALSADTGNYASNMIKITHGSNAASSSY